MRQQEIVIVGAGISGSVLAERYACQGKKVLVIEKRDHIGGNCFDYTDENGIIVSKYGAHLFHTNDREVWEYVNRFTIWQPWEHQVVARVDEQLVPVPVNRNTVNLMFGENLQTDQDMKQWLEKNRIPIDQPTNGEEAVLNSVGLELYEKLFKHYTKKQWDKYPDELDASVLNRIPVRLNEDGRYFSDRYQAIPIGGYTRLFERMLDHPNIEVMLNTDYADLRDDLTGFEKLFYTGPIDRFFEFKKNLQEKLEYRSIRFEFESLDMEFFQENSVVNYPGTEVDFTRIVEYKHFGNQKSSKTTISREFTVDHGDPYYPVPNPRNQQVYESYRREADKLSNVYFVGRLASYKYFNMDQAFRCSLDLYHQLEEESVVTTNTGLD
ncbi:UDP-galactopyranose mutase [Algoriphagus terrigena]|uniref:UDP-galactopyranose mutase n=1 Tax=Algoriphagus terrigena TaxID=344884 RepID=UPI0004146BC5|nr:UDP-galactopyranose mutase [Algoriphagus terrigena]